MPKSSPIPSDAVHYQLTRFQIVGQWYRSRMLQRQKFIIYGFILLCGIVMIASQGLKSYLGWVFVLFPFLFAFLFYRGISRAVTQHPEMLGPRWVSFDEDGVVFAIEDARTEYAWSDIRKFTQNNEYYLLHLDNHGSAATLPKTAFTPEQRERFLSLVKAVKA